MQGTRSVFGFKPGDHLANGSTILLVAGPGQGDYAVILAKAGDQYVTWRVGPEGVAFWGDYFPEDCLEQACESFIQRAFALNTSEYGARKDADAMEQTLGDEVSNALAAIICNTRMRDFLTRNDPKLLQQARTALGLNEVVD